jgi:hypothetical protein
MYCNPISTNRVRRAVFRKNESGADVHRAAQPPPVTRAGGGFISVFHLFPVDATDGATSARVFGSFISWMQDKQASGSSWPGPRPVFGRSLLLVAFLKSLFKTLNIFVLTTHMVPCGEQRNCAYLLVGESQSIVEC